MTSAGGLGQAGFVLLSVKQSAMGKGAAQLLLRQWMASLHWNSDV